MFRISQFELHAFTVTPLSKPISVQAIFCVTPTTRDTHSTTVFAVTWSGRGGARATNEDSNASLDPPTAALLVMSAAGTDERAPLLLGADAASSGWGWRKRALATVAIVGTLAACACAVAATGETLIDP